MSRMTLSSPFESLRGGLIVSCQALPGEPLFGALTMAAMARAAVEGGAVAIRANGPEDISAIRQAVQAPILGLFKEDLPGFEVRITPTFKHAEKIASAGADILAIDATLRARPGNLSVQELIGQIHQRIGKPVLADVSTLDEGLAAARAGADLVATTLSGYTAYSPPGPGPDLDLLEQLVRRLSPGTPVIAEGRFATPGQAVQALDLGALAVVVGSAITRPQWITAQFARAIKEARSA